MKGENNMLNNLERLLHAKGITKKSYALFLGVNVKTVQNKLKGETDFTYPEVLKTQTLLFPEYRMEYLFESTELKNNIEGVRE